MMNSVMFWSPVNRRQEATGANTNRQCEEPSENRTMHSDDRQGQNEGARILAIDTSARCGIVGVCADGILHEAALDESRRHARDLAATCRALIDRAGFKIQTLNSIIVGLGPGSYTGLRVGLMTAKSLAYALKIPCYAVPTFVALAFDQQDVVCVADALQGLVYAQHFRKGLPLNDLRIQKLNELPSADFIGRAAVPGLNVRIVPVTLAGLLAAAGTVAPLNSAELFAIEPLYLRGSSAEEKLKASSPLPA
jgi:tRNA threonylcarbamoyladenosine biosynthesis protein TsaB